MSREALVGWVVLVLVSAAMWLTGERDLMTATWPGIVAGVIAWLVAGDLRRRGDFKAAQRERIIATQEKPRFWGI